LEASGTTWATKIGLTRCVDQKCAWQAGSYGIGEQLIEIRMDYSRLRDSLIFDILDEQAFCTRQPREIGFESNLMVRVKP